MITDFRLSVFITVARTLSFTRSAAMLNISQPAVSKHIKELEGEFAEPLFNRKGNTITLTPKGESIIPLVERILEGYGALEDAVTREDCKYEGRVRVGASTTISQYLLPEMLALFSRRYPNIRVSLISANSDEVVKMLGSHDIEIAFIEDDHTTNMVHYTTMTSDDIVLVSTTSPKRTLRVEDVVSLPLVIREEGSGTLSVILSALQSKGVVRRDLNIKIQLGSSEAIIRYIKSSGDYAFLSKRIVEELVERGELVVNEVEGLVITRQFRCVERIGYSGRLVNIFKEFCLTHYNI